MGAPVLLQPEVLSSGIGALGSLGTSFLNGLINRSSMAHQSEYAKDLMKYQWDNFQSPSAQVNALAKAGLNPAVALGQGGSGYTASPSVNMPSSTPPLIGGISDVGNFVKAMADAKKAGLDSVARQLENEYSEKTMEDRIKAVSLQNKWTDENTSKVIYEAQKLVADFNVLQHEADIKKIDAEKHAELINWQIQKYKDEHNLDDQQYNALKEQLPVILGKLKSEEKILNVDADIAESYKTTMSNIGVVGDAIKILLNIVKIFK